MTKEPPKLLDRVRAEIRTRHYSRRTEEAYVHWIRRYILFHGKRHPTDLGAAKVTAFLTWLAIEKSVAASTQNQAFSAVTFLYKDVLRHDLGVVEHAPRAKTPLRVPVVLSVDEVRSVLRQLSGVPWLVASLLYGAGLRLQESLELRVKEIDFDRREVTVRRGKGQKDRRVMLPEALRDPLRQHLEGVHRVHQADLAAGFGRVVLPGALDRKFPQAPSEWRWQFVFPAGRICHDPRYGPPSRFHLHESVIQRAVTEGGSPRGADETGDLPYISTFVRDPPTGGRLRHPHRAGTARPFGREHDHDLHARVESRWSGREEPDGSNLMTAFAAARSQSASAASRRPLRPTSRGSIPRRLTAEDESAG